MKKEAKQCCFGFNHYIIHLSPNFPVTDGRYGKKLIKCQRTEKLCAKHYYKYNFLFDHHF